MLPFLDLSQVVTVILSDKVWHKIQFLCKNISTVEWSGCIIYNIKGRLDQPEKLDIKVLDLIPLDKGTTGFTSYHFDERVLNFIVENDYLEYKIGHIHSHHSMKTFFSGTDLEEVNENSEHIKPYLSIIVNNANEFSAKLAFRMKRLSSTAYQYQDVDNKTMTLELPQEDEYVANYNCKVIVPNPLYNVDVKFLDQFNDINKPKAIPKSLPKVNHKEIPFFGEDNWKANSKLDKQLEFLFEDESMFSDDLKQQEKLFTTLLRLGVEIENDSFEQALEDIENCIVSDPDFTLEQYAYSLNKNFDKITTEILKLKPKAKDYKEQLEYYRETFIEELYFSQYDFRFVFYLIELLEKEN
jgi:tetratricopeptide (TPR) repeat protein